MVNPDHPFRRFSFLISSAIVLFLLFVQFSGVSSLSEQTVPLDAALKEMQVFVEAYRLIQSDFADTTKLDPGRLVQGAIEGMISTLDDPHSRYVSLQEARELVVTVEGEFGGIGISIGMENQRLTVISPLEGTPAWKAGLESGDIISKIDGDSTVHMDLNKAVERLRGRPGTKVTVEVERRGFEQPITVELTREVIRVRSVRGRIYDNIGYIRMSSFSERTVQELDDLLAAFRKERSLAGIVLDLRHNSGGVLDGAIDVSKRFLDTGVIVSIRSRDPRQTKTFYAQNGAATTKAPVVVLINQGSASASEIVAGAIKDNRRGVIIGTTSYGKGSVQTVEDLPDGSKMALTTARYFTPSGISIHGVGIEPDLKVEMDAVTETDRIAVQSLFDTDLITNFLWGKVSYTDKEITELQKLLAKRGVDVTREVLEWLMVRELSRRHDDQLYIVPHLDPQLKKAIDILKAGEILKPRRASTG